MSSSTLIRPSGRPPIAAALLFSAALLLSSRPVQAQAAQSASTALVPLAPVPPGARFDAQGHLDVEKATRAYLDLIPAEKRQASNKYFEGGYWLQLWNALLTIGITLLLLFTGLSRLMRDAAQRLTRSPWLRTALYFIGFYAVMLALSFPFSVYEGFYREHLYNQSHQAFSGWLRDQLVGDAIGLVLGALLVSLLYRIVRRLPGSWHIWGAAATVFLLALGSIIAPVYVAPLFNTYKPVANPQVTGPVLRMARANGIAVDRIYGNDASKQTTQVSANVSGLFSTTRITLNDNLLHLASLEEIESVTGHEMGHYILNHGLKMTMEFGVIVFLFFALLRVWLGGMQRRWGTAWGTLGIDDVALLPAVFMAITVIGLLATPLINTLIRTQEYEADMYGLNAAREPDGEAQIDLKLGQYRKMEPTPLEEVIFFDHPSGYTRIQAAMRWKSENAGTIEHSAGY